MRVDSIGGADGLLNPLPAIESHESTATRLADLRPPGPVREGTAANIAQQAGETIRAIDNLAASILHRSEALSDRGERRQAYVAVPAPAKNYKSADVAAVADALQFAREIDTHVTSMIQRFADAGRGQAALDWEG